jgi:SNF family Na+-dependent transporter
VWLMPALAVTVLTLVLSIVTSTSVAAGLVSVLWLASVSVLAVSPTPEVILQLSGQAFLGCLAAVLVAVLLARRQAFERL